MGFPEQEITVTGEAKEERDGRVVTAAEAEQGGNKIIKNAEAEIASTPSSRTYGSREAMPRMSPTPSPSESWNERG